MSERPAPRRAPLAASALALVSVVVALWPYASVIQLRTWVAPIVFVSVAVVVLGGVLRQVLVPRRRRLSATLTALAQTALVVMLITGLFLSATARLGVIPTLRSVETVIYFFGETANMVWFGSAPVPPTTPLVFVLTLGFGVAAIVLENLLTHDRVVLAAVTVAAVGSAPMVITRARVDVWWFVVFAILVLVLLRRSVTREPRAPRRSPLALAAGVGVAAILTTTFFAPSLPLSASGFGPTARVALNPTLDLGEDLRQPQSFDVVTLATGAGQAPYLRIATLSNFDGEVWSVDELDTQPLSRGFGPTELPEDLETQSTSIRVQDVIGSWLPVPYPATGATGLTDDWRAMPANRSVVSDTASPEDEDYTVNTLVVDPTLEDMRRDLAGSDADPIHTALPADLPANVAALAREVTADASTDYDRLTALQSWFRSQFRYSLDTPVEEGFDGSGADAVGTFLEVRSGYCVHFAAAFALMGRSLDMPTRIVVGFLPGTPTGENRGEETLYAVKSDNLHAWPEVYFDRWGWIPFEPTATRGTPTQFATSAEREQTEAATPSEAPEVDQTDNVSDGPAFDRLDDAGALPGTSTLPPLDLRPILGAVAALAVALLVPAAVRRLRRASRMARAARGDVGAAWSELTDVLVDLRIPVSDAETPRVRGIRLRTAHGAQGEDLGVLINALERASYARTPAEQADLHLLLRRVVGQLRAAADPAERIAALFLPRSLLPAGAGRLPLPTAAAA